MQNVVSNMCEKFYYDRLRIDRSLWNGKFDNNNKKNNKKNNVRSAWRPVSGSKKRHCHSNKPIYKICRSHMTRISVT